MKKTLLAVAVFAAASSANAGMYKACVDTPNQVPCEVSAWDVGGEALYYRNEGSNLATFLENNHSIQALPGQTIPNQDWGWGFRIEGSYHFSTGNDVTVNWARWDNELDTVATAQFGPIVVGDTIHNDAKFDIVNIEFAQTLQFGEKVNVRGHAGVQYANLTERFSNTTVANNGQRFNDTDTFSVEGWGPRIGVDGMYNMSSMMDGFGVFAKTGLAIISSEVEKVFSPNSIITPGQTGSVSHRKNIVAANVSIGANYTRTIAQGDITAKVAWESLNYVNAAIANGDLSWSGVSFGLKWVGNA